MGTVRNVQIILSCGHDGVLDNLGNYFMFLAFKKFYNLNINKIDKVILLKILKLKLRVASVETNGTIH